MKRLVFNKLLQLIVFSGVILFGCYSANNEEPSTDASGNAYQPVIYLQADNPQMIEGDAGTTSLSFILTISSPSQSRIDVSYVTADSTALAGEDFEYQKGLVTFNPGETQKIVNVQILGDLVDEFDENLNLKLASESNVTVSAPLATGTIQDNDDPVAISVGDASVTEGNAGIRKLLFPITLSAASGKDITVDFATADGVAITPYDYMPVGGQLIFDPGVMSAVVSVRVVGDTADEGDESFVLELQNEVNAILLDGSGVGTIVNDDPISGLQQRPTNLTCIAPEKPTVNTSIDTTEVFSGVGNFAEPVGLVKAANDTSQWYLVEKGGSVYRFDDDASAIDRELYIDVSGLVNAEYYESGLLGIAFHPDYESNRIVYLSYTMTGPGNPWWLTSRLSRFQSLDNGLTLDPSTELILLSQDQPNTNHNGGNIAFGPDGYLYLGLGDGGGGGDPGNRAQNTKNLFGTIVRIDVESGLPYGIPTDNPFVGNPLCNISTTGIDAVESCPEIFAWGFRNPWRWSFDSITGTLWLADVGQNEIEEVDIVERGGNYGWRIQEGFECYNPPSGCDPSSLVQPMLAYNHTVGQSITGGFVYRGTAIPELIGRYVFADFQSGKIFATTTQGGGVYGYEQLADTSFFISSFGQDENGELYFLDYAGGTIRKITQFSGTSNDTIPAALSDTGCTDPIDATRPASGLIPFDTNTSFWSDGAVKERFYAIPDGLTVDVDIAGDWQFPIGTVLVKNFRLDGSLIETRHMMRHTNGEWAGYTYEWNSDETDATRVIGGKIKEINGQSWIFPSETQCMSCHTNVSGFTLGPEHSQLNRDFLYPSTRITANQLFTADAIDVLTDPLTDSPENLPSLARSEAGSGIDTLNLDFDVVSTTSYSDQDILRNISVEDAGATLVLLDNTWRKTDHTFNITNETVLEFDYESAVEGEIQGIGFDENNTWNDDTRIFQIFGTQDWIQSFTDFNSYAGGGSTHYQIPVGLYYTGSSMSLVFVNDDDAGAGSNSRFSNVKIISCPDCLDFNTITTSSYADQDIVGSVSVADAGATLVLMDNTWRETDQTFDITSNTVLEFEFESHVEGEVQGIGFYVDNISDNADKIFKLHGTQNWGVTDFDTYTGDGQTHYQIPVGQYYTGNAMKMVLANDNDTGVGNDSRFRNVRIRESLSQGQGAPSLQDQVRSYLHVNCSVCHRPFGPTQSNMDLRFETPWPTMNVCDVVPILGSLGITDPKIIAPGDSARSILINRISRRDAYGMPPLGSNLVDAAGVDMLTTWIDSLTACPQ